MTGGKTTRIQTDVDFEARGKQVSFLRIPHSDNHYPFGFVPVPIAIISNGEGPTVLLTGGTHGDEYEGQVILRRMIQELDPESICGRLIVLPAINYLAAQHDARCWPGDNINMNRAYPGDPDVTPTPALAHYVETVILPMCDFGIDFHSGGKVSHFLPCGYVRLGGDQGAMRRKIEACDAFGAPITVMVHRTSDDRSLIAAGDRCRVPMISCELGGTGSISLDALRIGSHGLHRVLGILDVLEAAGPEAPARTRYVEIRDRRSFVHVSHNGLFEPAVECGATVASGQIAGWVHSHQSAAEPPREVRFEREGLVAGRRVPAQVKCGDYVFFVVNDLDVEALVAGLPGHPA